MFEKSLFFDAKDADSTFQLSTSRRQKQIFRKKKRKRRKRNKNVKFGFCYLQKQKQKQKLTNYIIFYLAQSNY